MLQSVTGPVLGVMATMVVPVLAPAPSPPVTAVPVLTSTPFGALPGQRVTHTITVSGTGTGTATATRVTFTTTIDLDGVAARASRGRCTVAARTVVCELGDLPLAAGSTAPTITITGTIHPDASAGALVRNRVSVSSGRSATSRADQVVSNAYLLPVSNGPTDLPMEGSPAVVAEPQQGTRSTLRGPAVAALLVGGAGGLGALLLVRRLRQRRAAGPQEAHRL